MLNQRARRGPEELNNNSGFIVNLSKIKPCADVGRLGPDVLVCTGLEMVDGRGSIEALMEVLMDDRWSRCVCACVRASRRGRGRGRGFGIESPRGEAESAAQGV